MIKVDWVTIVIDVAPLSSQGIHDTVIPDAIGHRLPSLMQAIRSSGELTIGAGRRPYAFGLRTTGFTIFYSVGGKNICIEISGIGCDIVREYGNMDDILFSEYRKTRLDIALDIECDSMPSEILASITSSAHRSKSIWDSPTGQTVYVGSQKSDRYLRIYRYSEPHERSNLLRLEFVLKDEYCMNTINAMRNGATFESVISGLISAYSISHPVITIQSARENRITIKASRSQNKTVLWLLTQVKPALLRLKKDGVITDLEKWVIDNLTK